MCIPSDGSHLVLLQIFRRFHAAFIDAVSNPFYTVNTVRNDFQTKQQNYNCLCLDARPDLVLNPTAGSARLT